jgi:hypothetical protein
VNRLNEDRCEGEVRVSAIGPGKPYRSMPVGSTGDARGEDAGSVPGRGAGGPAFTRVGGGTLVGVGCGFWSLEREDKTRALSEAPVAADTAAIIARVVLDMTASTAVRYRRERERFPRRSQSESQPSQTRRVHQPIGVSPVDLCKAPGGSECRSRRRCSIVIA